MKHPFERIDAEAYFNRGLTKLHTGHQEEAIADFDEAIRLKPDYTEAYNNRGYAKGMLKRYEEAIADLDTVIHLKPSDTFAYSNRGNAKSELGQHEEAIIDFDIVLRLDPDYVEAYNNRGVTKFRLGRYEEAIADFDEAIRLKPDYAEAYNNRGHVKRILERYGEAEQDQRTANVLLTAEPMIMHKNMRITYPDSTDDKLEIDVVEGIKMCLNLADSQLWNYANNDSLLEIQLNVFALPEFRQFLYSKDFQFRRKYGNSAIDVKPPNPLFKWVPRRSTDFPK